jgi:phosphocarrier protein
MPLSARTEAKRVSKQLTVQNELGLHARPAALFVRLVQSFRSAMWIVTADGKRYEAGRIMELLLANLDRGAIFTLEADGPDADVAVERIEKLLVELKDAEERGEHS